ncbi:hypothetical protein [Pseudomonas sp. A25(2017)]|uniref:hypothetical protein n=1 Tax=Pseudomonas sp. A25(2017) TaxID=1945865 RepID=UPI00143D8A0C|nr:hypothetical protein [Pseudomonas sp. A25(2017)]
MSIKGYRNGFEAKAFDNHGFFYAHETASKSARTDDGKDAALRGLCTIRKNCGSELAREGGGTVNITTS